MTSVHIWTDFCVKTAVFQGKKTGTGIAFNESETNFTQRYFQEESNMAKKRIISCSITGSIHSPSMSPYLPITPEQIARNAIDAAAAGAASVHIHVRNPQEGDYYGAPYTSMELFGEIIDRIRQENQDVIICTTTGGGAGMTVEERVQVVSEFQPELASMNAGTINWGLFELAENPKMQWKYAWEKPAYAASIDSIFSNTFKGMIGYLDIFNANGTKPELECYDVGHIHTVKWLMDRGYIKGKPFLQFVTGINGAIGACPESVYMMKETADRVIGTGNYEFSAFGAGKMEYSCCMQSLLLGGHVRVGMEDNLFLGKGRLAKSNAELVEKMAHLMKTMDYEIATPAEAREILGISR